MGNNLNQQVKAFNTALKTGMELPGILENLETVNQVRQLLREVQFQLLGVEIAENSPNSTPINMTEMRAYASSRRNS